MPTTQENGAIWYLTREAAVYLNVSYVTFQALRDTHLFHVEEDGQKKPVFLKDRIHRKIGNKRYNWYTKSDLDALKHSVS